jgi:hypothetical protein
VTQVPLERFLGRDDAALFREADGEIATESCGKGGGMTDERGDNRRAIAEAALVSACCF